MPELVLSGSTGQPLPDEGLSQLDRIFINHFDGLKVAGWPVAVIFYFKHQRLRDALTEKAQYPMIVIQPLEEGESDEHPVYVSAGRRRAAGSHACPEA